jgi:Protein of unknown function (DUF4012)
VKRWFLFGVLGLVAIITVMTIYVIARVGPQIAAARKILSVSVTNLAVGDIDVAGGHLSDAQGVLHGFPANVLRLLPIWRQNLDTVRNGVDDTVPVLTEARALRERLNQLQRGGVVRSGHISLASIQDLQAPLASASSAVASLVATLERERSGWLVPSIWDGVSSSLDKAREIQGATANGSAAALLAPDLLGANGARKYLVLLVNNAEVRPSGGIVSGIGLLTVSRGHFRLGAFHYYTDLAQRPYQRVPAPADFRRRYGRFKADTTRWVNVTLSPDTEEVAEVARRLYKATTGTSTDGAIIVDPHGVAAMLPPATRVRVPGTGTELTPQVLPRYVYSRAYKQLGGHTNTRHDALIAIGKQAFRGLTTTSFGGKAELAGAAGAVAGGHVRLVSFRPSEEEVLRRAGVTGYLRANTQDRLFVTETNFNGTKLDFWSHTSIAHTCDIPARDTTLCETTVALENSVPAGLSRYVAGDRPYGQLRSLLEVYLPEDATLQRVLLDSRPATFARQAEDGLKSVGVQVRVAPGETGHLVVDYALPPSPSGYSLAVTPQALAHQADLRLALRMPPEWRVSGVASHGQEVNHVYQQSGHLGRPQTITVAPYPVRGLSSLWRGLVDFWQRPVF